MFLKFPHKKIRAGVIKRYVGDRPIVCLSCGNAAKELEAAGCEVLHIGEGGLLTPNRWLTQKEIAEMFPNYFDATCGHLPWELMVELSYVYRFFINQYLDDSVVDRLNSEEEYDIMCGSGETLVCLKLAFPNTKFNAVYNVPEYEAETKYDEHAPLNGLVELLANKVTR